MNPYFGFDLKSLSTNLLKLCITICNFHNFLLQKYAIDDDVPPSKPDDKELQFEATEANAASKDSATAKRCSQEDNVGTSQHKERKPLSSKWTTGAGPRIGCVREYPTTLQVKALEQLNLSPRVNPGKVAARTPIPSPRPSPKIHLSPRLVHMGIPSPRVHVTSAN